MSTELDNLVAEIATNLPDKPTSAEILGALSKAARGGFAIGVTAGNEHASTVHEMINKVMWEER